MYAQWMAAAPYEAVFPGETDDPIPENYGI